MKKELYEEYFKDKKVTILGLGLLGRGIGDSRFLAEHADELIITDRKNEEELKSSKESLSDFSNITFHLGAQFLSDFEGRDFIYKASSVPLDSEYILHAKEKNIPVYMSAALVVKILYEKMPSVKVIGVTGTRGKSTTTHLIAHCLEVGGKKVHLGGNVRGVANLPLLADINEGDFLVLELDSWQLQGFKDASISPNIAVFTSFLDDHLNYYKGDREAYFNDKASIFQNQKVGDVLIASPQAHAEILKRGYGDNAVVPVVSTQAMHLIGEHNEMSVALAHTVGRLCGLSEDVMKKSFDSFLPVPGRLEYIGKVRGVHIYNDNNATTPDAVIVGIQSVNKKYNTKPIVIVGGGDKGLDLTFLENELIKNTKACIYLSGTGTDKITLTKVFEYEKLEDCVNRAFEISSEGDVILFSPGFASFSKYYNNEYERNDEFVKCIEFMRH